MPVYEYFCDHCNVKFEELLTQREEVEKYSDFCPCPECSELSPRIPSAANFNFRGTPGSSGSHDLDYPVLDKAVGRSAERRWKEFSSRKKKRDQARQNLGTNMISVEPDKIVPTDLKTAEAREKGIKLFKKGLSSSK